MSALSPQRVIDDLKELRALTGDATARSASPSHPVGRGRNWLKEKLSTLPSK